MARTDLTGVLREIDDTVAGHEVRLGDVVGALEGRGFGPLLLAPALITLLPTGAIPGVPTVCAALIACVAIQLAAGRRHPWTPRWLRDRAIERERLRRGRAALEPFTRRVDRLLRPRLFQLTRGVAPRLLAVLCLALATVMVPLELVPFAAAAPALAIALLGLGLAAEDGVAVLLGLVAALCVPVLAIVVLY